MSSHEKIRATLENLHQQRSAIEEAIRCLSACLRLQNEGADCAGVVAEALQSRRRSCRRSLSRW